MTCYVSSGTLNPTHSLTHLLSGVMMDQVMSFWCCRCEAEHGAWDGAVDWEDGERRRDQETQTERSEYQREESKVSQATQRWNVSHHSLSVLQLVHTADKDKTKLSCLVLSCPCRRCEHSRRQDKTVLFCFDPVSSLQLLSLKCIEDYWKLGNWKLGQEKTKLIETGSRPNKTVLSCLHMPTQSRQAIKADFAVYISVWNGEREQWQKI